MGSATTYSFYDAITLDRHTGEEVSASEILEMNDSEVLETVNELMELDEAADWNDLDFYLEDKKIVFFYRIPNIWEEVVLERQERIRVNAYSAPPKRRKATFTTASACASSRSVFYHIGRTFLYDKKSC